MASCCPNGIFLPLIQDCCGTTRGLGHGEMLRVGDELVGAELHFVSSSLILYRNAIVIADATSGALTVTLPPVEEGLKVVVKKVDSSVNDVTVDGDGSDTIDGGTTQVLSNQYDTFLIVSDGTTWHLVTSPPEAVTPGTVDNAVVRADGTSNDTVQGSLVTIEDDGRIVQEIGTANNSIGNSSTGDSITTGTENFFAGANVGRDCTSGSRNMGLGSNSLQKITTGENNDAMGRSAFRDITTSSLNVGVGSNAGITSTGSQNTFIGSFSGFSMTTGSTNVFIGNDAGRNASQLSTASNSIGIGNGVFTTASNQVVLGNTSITSTILRGDITIEDTHDLVFNTSTGSKIATATNEKIAFWGATPIVQPAAANQAALTNSTGGTRDGTLAAVTDTSASDQSGPINDNFTDVHELLNEIRTALVNAGLIKGAA